MFAMQFLVNSQTTCHNGEFRKAHAYGSPARNKTQPPVATAGECDGTDCPQLLQKAMREALPAKSGKIPKASTALKHLGQYGRKSHTNIELLPQIV